MDTREKILPAGAAIEKALELRRRGKNVKVIAGFFDVLQPAMVRAVQAQAAPGTSLFAIVGDPENAVTSRAARIESAASLRVIDYVVHWSGDPEELVRSMQPNEFIRSERAHIESTEGLKRRVHEKHDVPVAGRHGN